MPGRGVIGVPGEAPRAYAQEYLSDDSDLVPKDGQGNPTRPSGAIGWHVVSSSIEDVPVLVITPVLA